MKLNVLKQKFINSEYYYFHTEDGLLLCGDCKEILKIMDITFDLVILDPNFEIWHEILNNIDFSKLIAKGYLLTFSRQPYTTEIMNCFSKTFRFADEIIWHDPQPIWVSNNLPLRVHENILVFRKGNKKMNCFVGDINLNKEKKKGKTKISSWSDNKERIYKPRSRKMITSLLTFPRNLKEKLGRWKKPEKLFETLISAYSNENEIVLDCFMGAGTTAIVCENLNRKWIGIEANKEYCEIIKERVFK